MALPQAMLAVKRREAPMWSVEKLRHRFVSVMIVCIFSGKTCDGNGAALYMILCGTLIPWSRHL